MTHPVFGDIRDDPRIGRKDSKGSTNRRGANFATSSKVQGVSVLTASFQAISCGIAPSQVSERFLDGSPSTPHISTHREMYENLRRHHHVRILMSMKIQYQTVMP